MRSIAETVRNAADKMVWQNSRPPTDGKGGVIFVPEIRVKDGKLPGYLLCHPGCGWLGRTKDGPGRCNLFQRTLEREDAGNKRCKECVGAVEGLT